MRGKEAGIVLMGAVLLSVSLAGCNGTRESGWKESTNSKDRDDSEKEVDSGNWDDSQEAADSEVRGNRGEQTLDGFTETELNLSDYSLDYVFDTDNQPNFLYSDIVKGGEGYYMWDIKDGSFLMYYDPQTEAYVPVCGRPDCSHSDESCDACFRSIGIEHEFIQYYDGFLYTVGFDRDGIVTLYRVSLDGSSREQMCVLYRQALSESETDVQSTRRGVSLSLIVHRGMAYYTIENEEAHYIRRVELKKGAEPEIIFESRGERSNLYRLKAYGDYLFFQSGNFVDEDMIDMNGGIFAYNIQTDEVQLLKKNAISYFLIHDEELYYSRGHEIIRFSLKNDRAEETVLETHDAYAGFTIAGDHLIVGIDEDDEGEDDSAVFIFYDLATMNIVKEVAMTNGEQEVFYDDPYGDDRFLFASGLSDSSDDSSGQSDSSDDEWFVMNLDPNEDNYLEWRIFGREKITE